MNLIFVQDLPNLVELLQITINKFFHTRLLIILKIIRLNPKPPMAKIFFALYTNIMDGSRPVQLFFSLNPVHLFFLFCSLGLLDERMT